MAKDFDPTLSGPNKAKPKKRGEELALEHFEAGTKSGTESVTIAMSGELRNRLAARAAERAVSFSELCCWLMEKGLVRTQPPSEPMFVPVESPLEPFKANRKPKSKGRAETCVHRIAPGNFCKFGCD